MAFTSVRGLLKLALPPALTLLVVPALGWAVATASIHRADARFLATLERRIDAATDLTTDEKPEALAFHRSHPASSACDAEDLELRRGICPRFGELWQLVWASRASALAFVLGLFGIGAALLLAALAWVLPRSQHRAFIAGWTGLTVLAALEVAAQGMLMVWVPYALVARLLNTSAPGLLIPLSALAGFGVAKALRGIFRRSSRLTRVEGTRILPSDAPALWVRLGALAAKVGAAAPETVIAGIDDNFFVTQSGVQLGDGVVTGRTLFVSLPLLRLLTAGEADAVLAHELAHLRGGDTLASAQLGPALLRYDLSLCALGDSLFTLPAFYLLRLFRSGFELARQRESRRRELLADRASAAATSERDLCRALLKVTAYSSHRAETERALFEQREQHFEALGLERRVAAGLMDHVATDHFIESISDAPVPHPFDSHPSLGERLAALSSSLSALDCPELLRRVPDFTWVELLPAAREIELRQWSEYEALFIDAHERALAYRYLPEGEAQRAVVEKSFPERAFTLAQGGEVRVTFSGLVLADGRELPFSEIFSASLAPAHALVLNHRRNGSAATRIDLADAAERAELEQTLRDYWHRHRLATELFGERDRRAA